MSKGYMSKEQCLWCGGIYERDDLEYERSRGIFDVFHYCSKECEDKHVAAGNTHSWFKYTAYEDFYIRKGQWGGLPSEDTTPCKVCNRKAWRKFEVADLNEYCGFKHYIEDNKDSFAEQESSDSDYSDDDNGEEIAEEIEKLKNYYLNKIESGSEPESEPVHKPAKRAPQPKPKTDEEIYDEVMSMANNMMAAMEAESEEIRNAVEEEIATNLVTFDGAEISKSLKGKTIYGTKRKKTVLREWSDSDTVEYSINGDTLSFSVPVIRLALNKAGNRIVPGPSGLIKVQFEFVTGEKKHCAGRLYLDSLSSIIVESDVELQEIYAPETYEVSYTPPEEFSDETYLQIALFELTENQKWFRVSSVKVQSNGQELEALKKSYAGVDPVYVQEDKSAETVVVPAGTVKIGAEAFKGCNTLKSVTLPWTVEEIETAAFEDCTALSEVIAKGKITIIGERAFKNCTALKDINEFLTHAQELNGGAFENTGVTEVKILKNINNLKSYDDLIDGSEVTKGAFYGCKNLKSATIGEGKNVLGSALFGECSALESVKLPSTLKSTGWGTFKKCTSLKTITIPEKVTKINTMSFFGSGLEEITIPSKVSEIGKKTFANCKGLKKLSIPAAVTKLEKGIVEGCSNLETLALPSTVTEIVDNPFDKCPALTSIIPSDENSFSADLYKKLNDFAVQSYGEGKVSIKINTATFAAKEAKEFAGKLGSAFGSMMGDLGQEFNNTKDAFGKALGGLFKKK